MALKENYKDDILDVSVNTKRKYKMTDNGDGTVSFDDETVYTQEGDSFGASDMNATNGKVNALETDIGEINDNLSGFKFYPIGTGIVGLIADDSAYIDEDGNYVIWGTDTAEQLVEDNPNTYKSVPSSEGCHGEVGADTATPFSQNKTKNTNWFSVYTNTNQFTRTSSGNEAGYSFTLNETQLKLTERAGVGPSGVFYTSNIREESNDYIDLTPYKYICIKGSYFCYHYKSGTAAQNVIYIKDENGNTTNLWRVTTSGTGANLSGNMDVIVDISSLEGNYKTGFYLTSEEGQTTHITVDKFFLVGNVE